MALTLAMREERNTKAALGLLWCAGCKHFDTVANFRKFGPKTRNSNYGYRYHCIRCQNDHNHKRQDAQSLKYKYRNLAIKAKFVELAGGRCQRCGYRDFYSALSFHHVYRSEKKHNPQIIINSGDFEKAWKELDKCCLLCMNCHIAYEAGMWRAEFIKREGLGYAVGEVEKSEDGQDFEFKMNPVPYRFNGSD